MIPCKNWIFGDQTERQPQRKFRTFFFCGLRHDLERTHFQPLFFILKSLWNLINATLTRSSISLIMLYDIIIYKNYEESDVNLNIFQQTIPMNPLFVNPNVWLSQQIRICIDDITFFHEFETPMECRNIQRKPQHTAHNLKNIHL